MCVRARLSKQEEGPVLLKNIIADPVVISKGTIVGMTREITGEEHEWMHVMEGIEAQEPFTELKFRLL